MKKLIRLSLLGSILVSSSILAQTTKTVTGFNHIESVVAAGQFLYVADIGKDLNPSSKDGDGKIIKLDQKGNRIDSTFVKEKLNSPKGLAINKNILFVNDIDRLLAIDLKTGTTLYQIDFSKETSLLNDIAVWDANTLYVSATDISKLFKVNLIDKSYTEIKIDKPIQGINGLFCYKNANVLYVNGFGSDIKPNGVVGYINLKNNAFTQLTTTEGYYDGLYIDNDILYTSNWVAFEKKGILLSIQLYNHQINRMQIPELIAGPADFIIKGNQIIVPAMLTGELHFIPFDNSLTQKL